MFYLNQIIDSVSYIFPFNTDLCAHCSDLSLTKDSLVYDDGRTVDNPGQDEESNSEVRLGDPRSLSNANANSTTCAICSSIVRGQPTVQNQDEVFYSLTMVHNGRNTADSSQLRRYIRIDYGTPDERGHIESSSTSRYLLPSMEPPPDPILPAVDPMSPPWVPRIKLWLNECTENHDDCHPCPGNLKFRLLDIDQKTVVCPRSPVKYAILEGTVNFENRIRRDYEGFFKRGSRTESDFNTIRDSSPAFKDCVELLKGLGLRYLWISDLCKLSEGSLTQLADIYNGAHIVVSAFDDNRHHGLQALHPEYPATEPDKFDYGRDIMLTESWPLERRTGTKRREGGLRKLQNHLLARRSVIFVDGKMFWRCQSAAKSMEAFEDGYMDSQGCFLLQNDPVFKIVSSTHDPMVQFTTAVMETSNAAEDREVSISSDDIFQVPESFRMIQRILSCNYTKGFIWGLPVDHLDLALLWTSPFQPEHPLLAARIPFQGPSWSWLGWLHTKGAGRGHDLMAVIKFMASHSDIGKWLQEHTWIDWHILTADQTLRKLPSFSNPSRGDSGDATVKYDIPWLPKTRDSTLCKQPPFNILEGTTVNTPILVFHSWSGFFKLKLADPQPSNQKQGVGVFYIYGKESEQPCGTIQLALQRPCFGSQDEEVVHEMIALSGAPDMPRPLSEAGDWVRQSSEEFPFFAWKEHRSDAADAEEFPNYFVMLVASSEQESREYGRDGISCRVNVGIMEKKAFLKLSYGEGTEWRQHVLG